ncbi:MAG: hypothetical protein R3A49_06490 [Acidimicrobiia bacterium]
MAAMTGVRALGPPLSAPSGPPPPSSVRPDVVRAVRARVGTGAYRPRADEVAERLVDLLRATGA